jgi:hypothetical protein
VKKRKKRKKRKNKAMPRIFIESRGGVGFKKEEKKREAC